MQQDSEFVREQGLSALRLVFNINERVSGGTGAFSGSQHRPSGQPGGGRFRTKAGRSHATETQKTRFSRPLLADRQKLTATIRRFISELGAMEQAWVYLCYRDRDSIGGEFWVKFRHSYCAAYEAANCRDVRAGTRAIIREMIAFRMRQMAGSIPWGARFESENGTISRQAWSNTYRSHWDRISDDLDRLDRNVLYKIGCKVMLI